MFSSVTLFTDRNVNRELFHHIIPTGMFSSLSGLFIITLSPLFAMLWLKLNHSNSKFNPSTPMKFALGLIFVGASFLALTFALKLTGPAAVIALGWIVSYYFIITLGELSLSPTGLSMVTALAPPRLTGLVMGLWFLSFSAAFAIGGKFADMTAVPKGQLEPALTGHIYYTNFLYFGLAGVGIGIVLILLTPYLRKLITA
jgi:POT family proton-dependent oligopeptide transporter